ncbi:hypothetical protein [Variovorax sp. SCN 67-20]|nr:hypothetical protein [Variovorax sp. SCN 67-20]
MSINHRRSMSKVFCAQVLLVVACAAASSFAAASDSVFLRCDVEGFIALDDAEKPLAETVAVEVMGEDGRLNIDIAGRDVAAVLMSRDMENDKAKMAGKNLSRDHDWYLVSNVKLKDRQASFETSVRINRLSGAFSFTQRGVIKKTQHLKIVADGTCIKQEPERKF